MLCKITQWETFYAITCLPNQHVQCFIISFIECVTGRVDVCEGKRAKWKGLCTIFGCSSAKSHSESASGSGTFCIKMLKYVNFEVYVSFQGFKLMPEVNFNSFQHTDTTPKLFTFNYSVQFKSINQTFLYIHLIPVCHIFFSQFFWQQPPHVCKFVFKVEGPGEISGCLSCFDLSN